jgi:hypothetical protein
VAEDDRPGSGYSGPPNSSHDPFAAPAQGFPPPYQPAPYQPAPYQQPGYQQPPYQQPGYPPVPYPQQPYQQFSPVYPPDPYGSYPQPATRNGLAIASLVCSLLGLCCGIGSLVGIGLGIAGLNQAQQLGTGRRLSIAGIVIGGLGVLAAVGWLIVIAANFDG